MSPSDEYTRRLRVLRERAALLAARNEQLGTARLSLFGAAIAAGWASWEWQLLSMWWLLLPAVAFIGVAIHHSGIQRARTRMLRAIAFYERGLARIEDRWSGLGATGERFDDPQHVYAGDLDLFGRDSLFQLLSTARTRMGENRLAQWLLAPASLEDIATRHACIIELRGNLDLREDLALLGQDTEVSVQPDQLQRWAQTPNPLTYSWLPLIAWLSPILFVAGIAVWSMSGLLSPLLVVLVAEGLLVSRLKAPLNAVLSGTEGAFEDLRLLAALPQRLEREPFESPQLQSLVGKLVSHGVPASRTIAKLATIVQLIESRRNPMLALLQIPLLYPVHVALAAQRWRAAHGAVVGAWLDAIGEIEALDSLAAYSYEHPHDPFPVFVDGPATFVAQSIGHPLLPAARCVRNDVQIDDNTRALLISGSNMSGKSTLLRTVGVNTVLAMAGAPVRALQLRLTPLQIGASIRVNDSLHDGSSRFYAEIQRLRQINDLSGRALPLLFLLDELLQGTNSKDRHVGAEGVVRAFLNEGGIGLISTHDLSLTDIDDGQGNRLHNHHFQDEIESGRLIFDYTLRDGVVTRSNGVELMRSIGLKV